MLNKEQKLRQVRRKTNQRLLFALVTLLLYFSFALNWTAGGSLLGKALPGTYITGSLLMFASLIVIFIGLEVLFLYITREDSEGE